MLKYALVGIGVNLNHLQFPPELDEIATSLRRELPDTPLLRREPVVAAILRELDEEIRLTIHTWRGTNNKPDRDMDAFSSWLTGKRVRVEPREGDATQAYTGTTAGLDKLQGFLRVVDDDGQLRTVLSGGLRELDN
jgi:BirA family biotin operon repressor/biotin-[acetyl-CoA-carboxylase] ligase